MSSHGKINSVRGMQDILPEMMARHKRVHDTAYEVARLHGFKYMATPIVEFSEVFKRSLGAASDVVHKEMYVFNDRKDRELVLRPENTASIVRTMISNGLQDSLPFRAFYSGPMFRYERPQHGRQRQFHQIGIESIGGEHFSVVDFEVIACGYEILQRLGLAERVTLHVNSLGDKVSRAKYRKALVKYLRENIEDLSEDSRLRLESNPLRILDSKDEGDKYIVSEAPRLSEFFETSDRHYFNQIVKDLVASEIPHKIDWYLVRGLDYYCHTVFEFVTNDLGAQGTVLAGGRYDGLAKTLGGNDMDGVGWAAGIERLALMLPDESLINKYPPITLITTEDDSVKHALQLAYCIRSENLCCDYLYGCSFKKQQQSAVHNNSSLIIILEGSDLSNSTVTLENVYISEKIVLSSPYEIPLDFAVGIPSEKASKEETNKFCKSLSKAFQAFYGESPE